MRWLLALVAAGCWAQSVESIPLRAVMLPGNEVPAVVLRASGTATIWLRVTKDAGGLVTGGTAEFSVRHDFAAPAMLTGLHIHRGAAGVNGPVVVDSGFTGPLSVAAGAVRLVRSAALRPEIAREILANPGGFYVNLHTAEHPGGALRGELVAADKLVFLTRVTPAGVVPPVTGLDANGLVAVTLLGARDSVGRMTSAEVHFELDYTGFPAGTVFTALHIHAGGRDVRGPATVTADLETTTPGPGGAGVLRYLGEMDLANPQQASTVFGLYQNPQLFYADLHTSANPAGAIRGQLARADHAEFSLAMAPVAGLDAGADAGVGVHVLRDAEGAPVAGMTEFDVHPRFGADTEFTGLHIHNGRAGVNGPVAIDSGIRTAMPATAHIFRRALVYTPVGLATMASLLRNPELHYLNLHTSSHPGGAVRSQLAAASDAQPVLSAAISAVWDPELRRVARGGLVTVFGRNLSKVTGAATGTANQRVPVALNGTSVRIGELAAPVVEVRSEYLIAQVPNETPIGQQALRVTSSNGTSNALSLTVDSAAPAIFFDEITPAGKHAAAFRLDGAGYQAVTRNNALRGGDVVLLYGTGFGITGVAPPETGALAAGESAPVPTVTIGGQTAEVIHSVLVPGLAGLNQLAVRMPNVTELSPLVVVRIGAAEANAVYLDAVSR